MTKKAQGISLNVVVVAALALLVLVILAVLVIQRTARTQEGFTCELNNNGVCRDTCNSGEIANPALDCANPQQVCCSLGAQGEDDSGLPPVIG